MISNSQRFLVTGGAGFIGSAFVRRAVRDGHVVLNLDKLTYAGSLSSLREIAGREGHEHVRGDITDRALVRTLFTRFRPTAVVHFAAESHVDRSIDGPGEFVQTNVVGTFVMLSEALEYWRSLESAAACDFRFVQISTDEVFGSLGPEGAFDESSPHRPNSPYSATKAAGDHLSRAWFHTYGLPVLTTNCTNNYGPYQFPEKLIPLVILRGLAEEPLPVYGRGENVRDWLHVDDHVDALFAVLRAGRVGETYGIGGNAERRNIDVVRQLCEILDTLAPSVRVPDRRALVTLVHDRPGHDLRYAMDISRTQRELGWSPSLSFTEGLTRTVEWYLVGRDWVEEVQRESAYRGERLGREVPA